MTEFGRSSISDAFSNFSCSSLLPMTFAACAICRMSSCNRLKTRIRLPSNWSVSYGSPAESANQTSRRKQRAYTLQMSEKEAPRHHCTTASMSSTLNDLT